MTSLPRQPTVGDAVGPEDGDAEVEGALLEGWDDSDGAIEIDGCSEGAALIVGLRDAQLSPDIDHSISKMRNGKWDSGLK